MSCENVNFVDRLKTGLRTGVHLLFYTLVYLHIPGLVVAAGLGAAAISVAGQAAAMGLPLSNFLREIV